MGPTAKILFYSSQPSPKIILWLENPYGEEECAQPLLTIEQIRGFQEPTEDKILSQFLAETKFIEYPQSFQEYKHIFNYEFQEIFHPSTLFTMITMNEGRESPVKSVEIIPGKCLYINSDLEAEKQD